MSMYNSVVGYDPSLPMVLHVLFGPDRERMLAAANTEVPRFRDAYIDLDGPEPLLVLFTRTGGGNREEYEEANETLRELPGFVDDRDDDFDPTFAHWRYSVPEEHRELVQTFIDAGKEAGYEFPKPMDRFKSVLGEMRS